MNYLTIFSVDEENGGFQWWYAKLKTRLTENR